MSRHVALADLPPAYRAQAERQLGLTDPSHAGSGSASSGRAACRDLLVHKPSVEPRADLGVRSESARRPRRAGERGPNLTERIFLDTVLLPLYRAGQKIVYEGLTLRLPGGSRYTPDFAVFDTEEGFAVILYEVKGSYRLPSEGRALTAFREARAAYPFFRFEWWKRKPGGGYEQFHLKS